jgi:CHAD domain-containing protein
MNHEMTRPDAVAQRHVAAEITRAIKELGTRNGRVTDEGVHEARRAIKRARAGLRLIRGGLGERKFKAVNNALREAGQAMSGARDERVLAQTVELLQEAAKTKREKVVMRGVGELLHIKTDAAEISPAELARVIKTLKKTRERVRAVKWIGEDEALIEAGLVRTRTRYAEAMRAAFAQGTDDAMHTWRKRVQDLRFQLVMLEKALPRGGAGKIKHAKKLSELLGLDHDLAVLSQRLAERPGVLVMVRVVVERMVAREREVLQKKAKTVGILM